MTASTYFRFLQWSDCFFIRREPIINDSEKSGSWMNWKRYSNVYSYGLFFWYNWRNKWFTLALISDTLFSEVDSIFGRNRIVVGLSPSKNVIIWFNDSPSKMVKNAFCFNLKALFVLKIFRFLSWLFGHVEQAAWLER